MLPAQPPFPTTWSFPFQFSTGRNTAASMCESEDGISTNCTRQYAGTAAAGPAGPPRPPPRPPGVAGAGTPAGAAAGALGAMKGPAGTNWIEVTSVWGSDSF